MSQTPPPVGQAAGAAPAGLARRLSDLQFKARFPLSRIWGTMIVAGVGWFVFRLVGPSFGTTFGERVADAALAAVIVAVLCGVLLAIIAGIQFTSLRSKYPKLIPDGAAMASDFGPQGFSVHVGDYHEQVALDTISAVRMHDDGMVVLVNKGKENRRRQPVVVPRELVPPQIAQDYPNRFSPTAAHV